MISSHTFVSNRECLRQAALNASLLIATIEIALYTFELIIDVKQLLRTKIQKWILISFTTSNGSQLQLLNLAPIQLGCEVLEKDLIAS